MVTNFLLKDNDTDFWVFDSESYHRQYFAASDSNLLLREIVDASYVGHLRAEECSWEEDQAVYEPIVVLPLEFLITPDKVAL